MRIFFSSTFPAPPSNLLSRVIFLSGSILDVNNIFFFKFSRPSSFFPQVVERRKQIEIEEQEIRRKEKELMSTVKLPAEAEAYKVQTIAEGKR